MYAKMFPCLAKQQKKYLSKSVGTYCSIGRVSLFALVELKLSHWFRTNPFYFLTYQIRGQMMPSSAIGVLFIYYHFLS